MFRLLASSFLLAGLISFILGVYTYSWPQVQGRLIKSDISRQYESVYPGFPYANRSSRDLRSIDWVSVQYEYFLENTSYTNSMICVCLPFAIEVPNANNSQSIEVYHSEIFPNFSVIIQGPDLKLVAILLLLSGAMFFTRSVVLKKVRMALRVRNRKAAIRKDWW